MNAERGGLLHRLFQESRRETPQPARLKLDDIQGLILRGYRMRMVRHFLLKVNAAGPARKLVGRLVSGDEADAPRITTAKDWPGGVGAAPRGRLGEAPACTPHDC